MVLYTAKTNEKIAQITANLVAPFASELDKKCFVFCEDKNSLMLESAIARKTGGSFNVCVNSFSRYVSTRYSAVNALSKSASSLVVYDIISGLGDKLSRIKLSASPKLSENIYRLIAQLKSAKVKPCDLVEIIEKEKGAFSTKLGDIYKIYAEYEKYLEESDLYDSNNFFALIPDIVKNDRSLKGAKVVFSGFSSVTRQIIDVIQAVSAVADCDFVLLKGDGAFYTNEIYNRVLTLFPQIKVCEVDEEYSFEKKLIEKWLFNPLLTEKDGLYSDKVRIIENATQIQEVENVARRIRYEVVKNGKRYKDFAIATQNPAEYNEIICDVFKRFEIPFYVDLKNTPENHPLIRLILSALEVARLNYLPSAVLGLCSERLFATQEEYDAFERYLKANSIGRRAFKKQFSADFCGVDVENIRLRVIDVCERFKSQKTAKDFVRVCKNLILDEKIIEKAKNLSEELEKYGYSTVASVSDQVLKRVDRIFSEIESIVGDKPMNATAFKQMFQVATSSLEVSILPLFSDVVYVGDFKSVSRRESVVLFAMGMYGEIPKSKADTALLTDRDLIKMEAYKCIIEPKIQIINKRERENVGVALMSFSEKIYLSYPVTLARGENALLCEIIDYFKKIFKIKPTLSSAYSGSGYDETFDDVYSFMTKEQGAYSFARCVNDFCEHKISSAKMLSAFLESVKSDEKAYKKAISLVGDGGEKSLSHAVTDKLSASIIEKYFSCPYACFANYNLGLNESETGEARALEFGNLLHAVLEKFVARIDFATDIQSCKSLAEEVYDEVICSDCFASFLNKKQYEHIFAIVKSEAVKRCAEIYFEYKNSNFLPSGQEVAFGNLKGATYKAIEIDTPYGKRYISGKVDRIDKFGNYVRVIDYKTGKVDEKIKDASLYTGTNIQLYLYPQAFLDDKTKLAGVYYYEVTDKFKDDDSESNSFVGKTLLNNEVILATDTRLKNDNESKKYDIKMDGSGAERKAKSSVRLLTEEEFDCYMRYAKKICASGSAELDEGFISPIPYDGACEYCKFGGMCGYDAELEINERKVSGINKSTIINSLKEEE